MTFKKSAQRTIAYDSRPHYVDVVDINNDIHLDIIVANTGADSVGIFFGNGHGLFQDQIMYSAGDRSTPVSVAHGYFNNDTRADLIVAFYGINCIGVLIANDNGSFRSPIIISLRASRPITLAVADFNPCTTTLSLTVCKTANELHKLMTI
jgi:hypothetical protein